MHLILKQGKGLVPRVHVTSKVEVSSCANSYHNWLLMKSSLAAANVQPSPIKQESSQRTNPTSPVTETMRNPSVGVMPVFEQRELERIGIMLLIAL